MEDPTVPIPKLPNDVIVEILTWVPVKPLLKFRCVCKSWLTLISSKQFVTAHLENSKLDPDFTTHRLRLIMEFGANLKQCSVNCVLYEPVFEPFDLSCPFQSESVWVVGSCNGLVCLWVDHYDLILWNPSTRIWKKLPDVGENFRSYIFSNSGCGFGFDKSSDDYKVVAFCDNDLDISNDLIVKVYSLRNDEWKRIENFAKAYWVINNYASFVNGKLYWLFSVYNWDEDAYIWDIVSFDLEKEEAEILQLPSDVKHCWYARLGMSGDSLFVLSQLSVLWASADVWMMDGCSVGNDNWTKVITIDNGLLIPSYIKTLCVKNGRILLFCMMQDKIFIIDAKDCSISYPDLETKFRHLQSFFDDCYINISTYFESLVSPLG